MRFVNGHQLKAKGPKSVNWRGGAYVRADGYRMVRQPEHPRANGNGYVREHILIAERALGKPLPEGAEVHHVNTVRRDNGRGNLVICQDHAFHALLERRGKALRECGNASWVKCRHCQQYDDPARMWVHPTKERIAQHRECGLLADRAHRARRKTQNQEN